MNQQRLKQIEDLYHAALRRAPLERFAWLGKACSDDPELQREVESLLSQHEGDGGILRNPLADAAAELMTASTSKVLAAGTRLGQYEILGVAGAGGMGQVYRAKDTRLDRTIAIKVISPDLILHHQGRERFEREARAVSRLNHPNICTLHDVGQQDGIDFLVMEYLEGETLAARLSRGVMPMDEVLRVGLHIAAAVAHAHDRGIIHRDLKPANTIVTPEGQVKVLDFGLAKLARGQELAEATTASGTLQTEQGLLIGTLPYMAPEQLRGGTADARTDVWALGVILYEMATGARPFQGQTGFELSSAILSQEPAPLPEKMPRELRAVIGRCLEKAPERRYQRAGEMFIAGQFSPNGQWVAYISQESGDLNVYVRRFPEADRQQQISTGPGGNPKWRHDGKALFYVQRTNGDLMEVDLEVGATIEPGATRRLFNLGESNGYAVLPNVTVQLVRNLSV